MLAPGGFVFIIADSPYLRTLTKFIPEFEKKELDGEDWPGLVNDMSLFEPDKIDNIPKMMHFMSPNVLSKVFSNCGFLVQEATYFARGEGDGFPEFLRLDGREGVAFVGRKPA